MESEFKSKDEWINYFYQPQNGTGDVGLEETSASARVAIERERKWRVRIMKYEI